MKKSLLALAIGALAVVSTANANWYVQGDLGYSKIKSSGDDTNFSKNKFTPSLTVGYKLSNTRFALDYTYYGKSSHSELSSYDGADLTGAHIHLTGPEKSELKLNSFGFSAIYDIDLNSPIVPYIGARLSYNTFKFDRHFYATNGTDSYSESNSLKEHKFGYGVLAGVSYNFAPNWAVNGGIEYNRLGKFNDVKVNQYGAKVGLRYEF
ncbi:hypothetical protein BKK49_07565 [Rodentibacter rarus]|uniref:Porin opacity type domain-containing protein n=1 Tax=Rodentibacter rarus TaxID=1908260 RepID=A0A1V3INS5_9PAST|nr:opacity family porin [Rodentibacter rarus]OOF39695.1 hypothetical protein BKK49_07565 [Rodentibacter rarus]OOF43897.1 hypothetical protein BKK50_03760 [Rodentibacter rarus]